MCITFVGTRSAGYIFRHTLSRRQIKDLSASSHHHPFSVGRCAGGSQILSSILYGATSIDIIRSKTDIYFLRLTGGSIHLIDISAILKHNGIAGSTRELYIIFGKVSNLRRLFSLRIINKDIHGAVTVGKEKYIIADPHGEDILSNIIRYIFH